MGNWNINIQGTGCHHNNDPKIDADKTFQKLVEELKAQGHTIESATFTYGGVIRAVVPTGKEAYENYRKIVGNKNFTGAPMPDFENLTDEQRTAWAYAANPKGLS